jgi:integrase
MYQGGSLRKVQRKDGLTWLFRYRIEKGGHRVENTTRLGLVSDFPSESAAQREVDRLGLRLNINPGPASMNPTFAEMALKYFAEEYGEDAERPKANTTKVTVEHCLFGCLTPKWGKQTVCSIEPKAVRDWLKTLRKERNLAAPSIAKIKTLMSLVFQFGKMEKLCDNNPCKEFRIVAKSHYKAVIVTPEQARTIIRSMKDPLHRVLIITAALTGLRASELAGLQWQCVDFVNNRIVVNKRWALGEFGKPKTECSDASVSMGEALARVLSTWRQQTPYYQPTDFVFASLKSDGAVPLRMSGFAADHLRRGAIEAGVKIEKGQRFGLHNLRHSLSHWLVNKGKVEPKTVQSMLRHRKIQTTLDLYTQGDSDEMSTAQQLFADAVDLCGLEKLTQVM